MCLVLLGHEYALRYTKPHTGHTNIQICAGKGTQVGLLFGGMVRIMKYVGYTIVLFFSSALSSGGSVKQGRNQMHLGPHF